MIEKYSRLLFALVCAALFSTACYADESYRLLEIDGQLVKWGAPNPGTGALVSYHLATVNSHGGSLNCRGITPLGPLLSRSHLTRTELDNALNDAFHAWEAAANVRFVRVSDDKPANLTIGAEKTPDGIGYTDVTTTSSTSSSIRTLTSAVICLNPRLRWTAMRPMPDAKLLRYVLEHEIGHALGLDHPGPAGQLMSFEYSRTIQTLQLGDIAGIRLLYGRSTTSGAVALNAIAGN